MSLKYPSVPESDVKQQFTTTTLIRPSKCYHTWSKCVQEYFLCFLQGTTGAPKGATLTHHNIVNNSLFTGRIMDYHIKVSTWPSPLLLNLLTAKLFNLNFYSLEVVSR